tara:strand:+ start:237 stop:683 length:447 start_codon:yes stop_codon:yes gene_type:complete
MSSFFNREDSLDREFAYLREQREQDREQKEKENKLEKQIEILKKEINELKEDNDELKGALSWFNHLKRENKWYENFFEEAILKYMYDDNYFKQRIEPFPKYKCKDIIKDDDNDSEKSLNENKKKIYQQNWRRKNPNYYKEYYRNKNKK